MPSRTRSNRCFVRGHFVRLFVFGCVLTGGLVAMAQAQQPAPGFRDLTAELGLQLANSKACGVDVDNDGWADLCAGGVVWRNNVGKGFAKLAEGFGEVVAADFDNDGFADLFSWSPIRAYRNKAGKGFEPVEMPMLPKCVSSGACWGDFNGEGNQNDLVLHFGLGDNQKPVRFEIFWPNGKTQTVENVEINRSMTVRFGNQP